MLIASITSIAIMLVVIIFSQLTPTSRAGKNKPGEGKTASLSRLSEMRELMWLFQTHRGKSIAFLSGDRHVESELRNIQSKIQHGIKKLKAMDGSEMSGDNWGCTMRLWQKVLSKWRDSPVEVNFKMHNALIKQHMFAMEDEIGLLESRQILLRDGGFSHFSSSLLNIIEFMGQTRAIGTNVTSSGKCQSIAKIRLCYLSQKLQASVAELQGQDTNFRQRENLITPVVSCVRENLLPADNLMSTKDWFALCTKSIDALYAYFDQSLRLPKFEK